MKQPLSFTKMHGLGNDFVIIDASKEKLNFSSQAIAKLADRHTGIGFDQLLIIEPALKGDYFCRIYNADGSEAEQCGNGLRCVARYIHEEGLNTQPNFTIETKAGIYPVHLQDYEHICITMGAPTVKNSLIDIQLNSETLPISVLSVGNPHAILKVPSIATIATNKLGPAISMHQFFPQGANVGFMEILDPNHIRLRTFERGAGETFACGSNACAAAVAGITNGWLQHHVTVEFRYGSLLIEWEGGAEPIHMTGPAARVYSGELQM